MKTNKSLPEKEEVESLKECNTILKNHMYYLRQRLKEKEELLEQCYENLETLKNSRLLEKENAFTNQFFKISLN
jgi:hypothetical protein